MDNNIKHWLTVLLVSIISFSGLAQIDEQTKLANEYYIRGDLEKAEDLFQKSAKRKSKIPQIHANYLALLLNKPDVEAAIEYLQKTIEFFPGSIQYQSDLIYSYHLAERTKEKEDYLNVLLKQYERNQYQLNLIAQNLVNRELLDDAIIFLKRARRVSGNPHAYALDMAAVYRMKNDKDDMTEEYLNYAMINPGNTNYIKNIFQVLLSEEEDLDHLEQTLIKKIQRQPDQLVYMELLIWVELQRRNFYGAFIQARAMDKRTGRPGDEVMQIGEIALDNEAWEDAIEIYDYIINTYPGGYHYAKAKQKKIKSSESLVKNRFPVDQTQIRALTKEYQLLYDEIGPSPISFDALRNKALLHAFYLDEKDIAIQILNNIVNTPRTSDKLVSTCKLNLGDIYLLNGEPWEASLLYSQVEKSNKYSVTGYEAKLKNAKLHYFTGNFSLAKSHLDILKKATTKEISNDAIDLGLLINNNTVFDTTDLIMQQFANIELLRYQHKDLEAKSSLLALIEEHPQHSLVDEAYWLLADIDLKHGNFQESLGYLESILEKYDEDILGDDALFLKCEIIERQMADTAKAQELYREFIDRYPGSMYVAEARKRFRNLRGDFIN